MTVSCSTNLVTIADEPLAHARSGHGDQHTWSAQPAHRYLTMFGGMDGGRESRTGQRVRLVGSLQKAHTVSRVVGARLGIVMVAEMAHRSNGLEGGNWLFLLLVAEWWELLEAGEKRWASRYGSGDQTSI